jgi:hypothetical protein
MSRGARAARGAAVAVFATFVASLAHTIGGGALPGPVAVLVALAFSTPLAVLLTGARMRLLRTSVAALLAQAALHLLYAMGGSWTAVPVSDGMTGHAAHAASAVHLSAGGPALDHGHAAIMPLAHVVAAALTVAFLAAADRAIAAISVAYGTVVRGIRLLIAVLAGLPVPTRPGTLAATIVPDVSPNREALLLSSLRHRGPPVARSAA